MFTHPDIPELALLGDPHLGKTFTNGAPIERRGEREAMQWRDFHASLVAGCAADCELHACVGDLFDRMVVPYDVVLGAAEAYSLAIANAEIPLRDLHFAMLRGNHDASRDMARVSAFEVLKAIIGARVQIVDEVAVRRLLPHSGQTVVLVPWHPFKTAEEMVREHAHLFDGAHVAIGHWDVVAIEDRSNLIPAALLRELGVERAVTGHDHLRRGLVIDGLPVLVAGSMQPYSHVEDPDERIYVTRTLDEACAALDADPGAFRDKCLRVVTPPGRCFERIVDCLQLSVKPEGAPDLDAGDVAVAFDAFDFDALFARACAEAVVGAAMRSTLRARFDHERLLC